MGTQLMKHPVLERLAEELGAALDGPAARKVVHDTDVTEIELRCADDSSLRALGREPAAEEGVDENVEVRLHGV